MTDRHIPKKPTKVAIFGSCTTRDNFNSKFNLEYKDFFTLVCFQHQTSIMSLMSDSISYNEESLSPLKGWDKRIMASELNKTFFLDLVKEKPDILIMDFFADARFKTIEIDNAYLTVNEWKTIKSDFYKALPKDTIPFTPSEVQLRKSFSDFSNFMKTNLPETKIILNQARGAKSYTDKEGNEEFFNQKVVNKINKRWEMLDNLFIEIVKPLQIDVMNPTVKGYVDHLWSIGYVHYTPNFYHNFLKTLISIEFQNQVEFLKSSLAKLVPTGLFPEEKLFLIEEIRSTYISLNPKQKKHIDDWLDSRYKEFLVLLVAYNKNIHQYVKFVSYAFRGGIKNVTARDINFAQYLIEPVIERKIFPQEQVSAYANLNYGNIQYHNFITASSLIEQTQYFKKAHYSLLFTYEQGNTDYLKNRSAYFLAHLYAGNKDFDNALLWYKCAIDTPQPAPNIYTLPFLMLLRSIGIIASKTFEDINKIFTKDNTTNKNFWILLQEKLTNNTLKNNIQTILETCSFQKTSSMQWKTEEIEVFFSTLNKYLQNTLDVRDYKSSNDLQSLYRNKLLTDKGKSNILFQMADVYAYKHHDLSRSLLMVSESNTITYTTDKSYFISTLILTHFSQDIRHILMTNIYTFKSSSVNSYIQEHSRNIAAWKRFIARGFVSGYFDEEIDFLEFILLHTKNKALQRVLTTRLAYLYYTGTAGISEDHHNTPNIEKSRAYFRTIQDNPLVKKYLQHPRLAIYQDMEQYLDNKRENYLFFENKKSDELLIVFSCAGSYARYTQLKVFYKKNQTNVLFLNNPSYNWYHGKEWKRIQKIIEEVALKNFKKENIITYFGSMGGYAALRTGLTYGFRTIVFNPQIDLEIWMKHRPAISVRLLKEKKLYHLQDMQTQAFEQMPLYYATSSAMEDVEAFQRLIRKISLCKEGLYIFEKIPDNIHEGIFGLMYKEKQQEALLNIAKIQKKYFPTKKYTKLSTNLDPLHKQHFWDFIVNTLELRVIIQISNGKISYTGIKNNFLSPLSLQDIDMKF